MDVTLRVQESAGSTGITYTVHKYNNDIDNDNEDIVIVIICILLLLLSLLHFLVCETATNYTQKYIYYNIYSCKITLY